MFSRKKNDKTPGTFQVRVTEDHILDASLTGYTTESIMRSVIENNKHWAADMHAQGRPALGLLDVSKTSGQSSKARQYGKKHMGSAKMDKIAVYGASHGVVLVAKYLGRASGVEKTMGFFRTKAQARQWLLHGVDHSNPGIMTRSIIALLIAILAGTALIGWQLDISVFKALSPSLVPMNPVSAVTFLLAALTLVRLRKSHMGKFWEGFSTVVIVWMAVYGLAGIIRFFSSLDLYLDAWLFTDKIGLNWSGGRISLASSFGFVILSVMFWAVLDRTRNRLRQYLFHALSTVVFVFAVSLLLAGYGFGIEQLYSFYSNSPVSLNTLLAFLLLAVGLQAIATPRPFFARVNRAIHAYWQPIVVFLVVILATGLIWQQTKDHVHHTLETTAQTAYVDAQEVIEARMSTYVNALGGFRALFAASQEVDASEFSAYFKSSELQDQYPGFGSISYAAIVPDADKAAFTQKVRGYANADFPQYKEFKIYPASTGRQAYPLLFASNPATVYGFDMASESTRLTTLEKARDTGQAASSGVIQFNAARGSGKPGDYGFFVTIPVFASTAEHGVAPVTVAERRADVNGFVLAYFLPASLFADIFKDIHHDDIRYTITDVASGVQLYQSKTPKVSATTEIYKAGAIAMAGDTWRLDMQIAPGAGHGTVDRLLPYFVLIGGTVLALLLGMLVLGQSRRRDQAMELADHITEDLHNERDEAVAVQQKDEAILASIGDAVFAIDANKRITLFNSVAEHITGFGTDEALGKPYTEVLRFSDVVTGKVNDLFIRRALAGHATTVTKNTSLLRKDGSSIVVAESAAPIRNANGKIFGAIVVFRDVSKEQELDRAKTEFVSLASHQLRTPLSAINWYSEMLLNGDVGKLNEEQQQYLQEIFEGNHRMVELVNSLLDVSRLDLGKLTNEPVPNDFAALISSIHKEMQRLIEKKQQKVTMHLAPKLSQVLADAKLLRIVVQNLMSNAIKYTNDKGAITVTARPATAKEINNAGIYKVRGPYLFFSVTDNGLGIPIEEQAHIFSKLYRADNVRTLDVEGTGLGLYIVREVVEKLGGRVWFESVENKGTTFFVVMPFTTPTRKPSTHMRDTINKSNEGVSGGSHV